MLTPFGGLPRIDLRPGAEGVDPEAQGAWRERCARAAGLAGEADTAAREVIAAVRERGDQAVLELTQRFEGRELTAERIEVDPSRWTAAAGRVAAPVRAALRLAARRVREFHQTQRSTTTGLEHEGERLHSRVAPLRRVAVYAPGGTAAYPSSVLMAGIPATVAGVDEVLLLTPRASDVVLLAAELAGVSRVFEIGGAQAIAAAALGTATVPRVDKIVGPGNAYVTAAKRQVYGLCDIDGIAGPSEILVMADASADPELVAADLISQAEHDRLACAVLVTCHPALADATDEALARQLVDLPRQDIATSALREHGAAVLVADREALARVADLGSAAPACRGTRPGVRGARRCAAPGQLRRVARGFEGIPHRKPSTAALPVERTRFAGRASTDFRQRVAGSGRRRLRNTGAGFDRGLRADLAQRSLRLRSRNAGLLTPSRPAAQ